MNANASYSIDNIEKLAWTNLNSSDFADNDYTGLWGRLKLIGNQLSDENGNAVQLRGWSTACINGDDASPCMGDDAFDAMKTWGANIIRLAVSPKNYSSETDDALIEKYIGLAAAKKMYVLVDWNVSSEEGSGNPADYKSKAIEMFTNITKWATANKYGNVLYEICSDCGNGVTWEAIRNYAADVLPVIEAGDPGSVVIVGTPNGSSDIDDAVASPISRVKYNLNLMYAFHFSSCSDMSLTANLRSAAASIPVFISKWRSVCSTYDGTNCGFCEDNSDTFLSYLLSAGNNGGQLVSWCYMTWGLNNSSTDEHGFLNSFDNCDNGYNSSMLTTSGVYIMSRLTGMYPIICQFPEEEKAWEVQDIPLSTDVNYGVLNIAYYNIGGEGVVYHDLNSSKYTDASQTVVDTTGVEYKCVNAGAVYTGEDDLTNCFRYDEGVDLTNTCAGVAAISKSSLYNVDAGDGLATSYPDLHNLCFTEPGEWMLYRINVVKPGYYKVKCLTNSATSSEGSIGMAIAKGSNANQNGNIIRRWSNHNSMAAVEANPLTSLRLNPTPSCGLMYDGSINPDGAANGSKADSSTCWGWTDCGGATAADTDMVVLFKYAGQQDLQISISPDTQVSPGDFSNFAFTFVSEDIPNWEFTGTDVSCPDCENEKGGLEDTEATLNTVCLFPNPASGDFTVKLDGPANVSIYDAVGAQVRNMNVVGDVVVKNNFAPGIYTVRVVTASGENSLKLVVK